MNVTESETHRCDLQLEDISEDEYQAMFLEGLQTLVNEARGGKVGDYIVLPYDRELADDIPKAKHSIEISDEDTDAIVQIGAVSMIKKGMKLAEEEGYWKNLKQTAEDSGEQWDDERTDIIGQNGNDGDHYEDDKEGM